MFIEKISDNAIWENSYLICEDSSHQPVDGKECAVIDPADKLENFFRIIEEKRLRLKYILLTHAHLDHVSGVRELLTQNLLRQPADITNNERKEPPVILMHKEEFNALQNGKGSIGEFSKNDFLDLSLKFVEDGEMIKVGEINIKVIHTPGHTKGSICCLVDGKHLFSGDTLFKSGIGRTDLYGGDYNEEIKSIKEKLLILPDDVNVYPGHGENTTIGNEKRNF